MTDIHSVILAGYNDELEYVTDDGKTNKGYLYFQNSYGVNWGDKGYGYLPYEYFNNKYVVEALIELPLFPYESEYDICFNGENMKIRICSGPGFTLTHNWIFFMDLYNSEDKIIGWIICGMEDQYAIEIIDFFVWPDYRTNGYGQLILDEFLEIMKSNDIFSIYGWFSKDGNEADGWHMVTKFFRDNGFDCIQNKNIYPWATGQISIDIY